VKINFNQRLRTIKGLPMFEKSFESMVVSKALKLAKTRQFAGYEEIAAFLDKSKVTFLQVVQEEGIPFCLKDVCVEALMLRGVKVSEELPGREDVLRFKLAMAVTDAKDALSVKPLEVRMMQELISHLPESYGPMITGQAADMLEEGEPEESDDREPPARLKSEAHEARREPREPRGQVPSRRN